MSSMKKAVVVVSAALLLLSCASIVTNKEGMKIHRRSVSYRWWPDLEQGGSFNLMSCTLAEEFTQGNGMVLAKDVQIEFYEIEGMLWQRSYVLARDWTNPTSGMVIKAGYYVYHDADGPMRSFTLGSDFRDGKSGRVLKGGTEVSLTRMGDLHAFVLAHNWTNPSNGMVLKAGVLQVVPGTREKFGATLVLAEDWVHPEWGAVLAADSKVTFTPDVELAKFFLARDFEVRRSAMVLKGGTWVELHPGGAFKSVTIARDAPAGNYTLKAGTVVQFHEKGGLKKATFAKPWKDTATGTSYEADKEYEFP